MDSVSHFLGTIEQNQALLILGQVFSALAGLGIIDTILRKIPWVRSSLVYVAKGIGTIEKALAIASQAVGVIKKGVFWLNDKIGVVVTDVRPPLPASQPVDSKPSA